MQIGQILQESSDSAVRQAAVESKRRRQFYRLWHKSLRQFRAYAAEPGTYIITSSGGVALRSHYPHLT